MAKKAEIAQNDALAGAFDVSPDEVELRTKYAAMRAKELAVRKDELSLADKAGKLCRIDTALSSFDAFLLDFVTMIRNFPDKVQAICPQMQPPQYRALRDFVEDCLERLSRKRLYLGIESTKSQKAAATEAVEASRRKATARSKEAVDGE